MFIFVSWPLSPVAELCLQWLESTTKNASFDLEESSNGQYELLPTRKLTDTDYRNYQRFWLLPRRTTVTINAATSLEAKSKSWPLMDYRTIESSQYFKCKIQRKQTKQRLLIDTYSALSSSCCFSWSSCFKLSTSTFSSMFCNRRKPQNTDCKCSAVSVILEHG